MMESRFMYGWVTLLASLALAILILTAFGIILGMVKPSEAVRHVGASLGILISLFFMPGIILCAWLHMSFWQQIALAVLGIGACLWLRPGRRTPKGK
jgi:hypothetical protein